MNRPFNSAELLVKTIDADRKPNMLCIDFVIMEQILSGDSNSNKAY